jgi:hypothetical protein
MGGEQNYGCAAFCLLIDIYRERAAVVGEAHARRILLRFPVNRTLIIVNPYCRSCFDKF